MNTKTSSELIKGSHWRIVMGVLLMVFGVAAIVLPFAATIVAEIWIAVLLLVSGGVQLVFAFQSRKHGGFVWKLLLSILYIAAGALLWVYPLQGVLTLTLVLAVFFLMEGMMRIILALQLRPLAGWGWVLVDGIITLILGGMIYYRWPLDAPWVIGSLLGLSLLFSGLSMIMLSRVVRSRSAPK